MSCGEVDVYKLAKMPLKTEFSDGLGEQNLPLLNITKSGLIFINVRIERRAIRLLNY